MKLKSGHQSVPVTKKENETIYSQFTGDIYQSGLIKLQPGNLFYVSEYLPFADTIYNFKLKPTDVVIVTFPKCGTTWTQEIVWTMTNNQNFDNEREKIELNIRSPFLDSDMYRPELFPDIVKYFKENCPGKKVEDGIFCQISEFATPDPRIIKTHLHLSLLPKNMLDVCKVVYVARNPKDTCLSYLHHHRLWNDQRFEGSLDDFIDYFLNDELVYSPFWEHVAEAWQKRDHKNMHFMFYEDMKKDSMGSIRKLNEFLETNLSEEQMKQIVEYTKFDTMKKRVKLLPSDMTDANSSYGMNEEYMKKSGGFYRKGMSGGWRNELSKEQIEKFDRWIEKKSQIAEIPFSY